MEIDKKFHRLEERVNLVDFLKLNEEQQSQIYRSCINKFKLDTLDDVVQRLLYKYEKTEKVFNFYGCNVCGGFHLTSGGKHRKKAIKRMILKTLAERKSK